MGLVLLPVTQFVSKGCSRDEKKGLAIENKALQSCKEMLLVPCPCPRHIIFKFLFHVSHRSHATLYSVLGIRRMKSVSLNGADSCLILYGQGKITDSTDLIIINYKVVYLALHRYI